MSPSHSRRHTEADDPHWLEWLTGLVSAGLVLALIGWLGWKALREVSEPPDLSVQVTDTEQAPRGFRVSFDVTNSANSTASSVTVRGELIREGLPIEAIEVMFDYVPAESAASGAMLFIHDPATAEMRLRATSFTDP